MNKITACLVKEMKIFNVKCAICIKETFDCKKRRFFMQKSISELVRKEKANEAYESAPECKSTTVLANETLDESYFTWCSAAVFIFWLIFTEKGNFPHSWECIMISSSIVNVYWGILNSRCPPPFSCTFSKNACYYQIRLKTLSLSLLQRITIMVYAK